MLRWGAICTICFVAVSATAAANEDVVVIPAITIEQSLHFAGSDGTDLLLDPGAYLVESRAESHLVLISQSGHREFLLAAVRTAHELDLALPVAILAAEDDDLYHLLLLQPGGSRHEAIGSRSGVHARGGPASFSPTPFSNAQLSQALPGGALTKQQLSKEIVVAGAPPAPVLVSPAPGATLAQYSIDFGWTPGTGAPAPTSFHLCIAEAGKPCARLGELSPTSILIPHLPPDQRMFPLDVRSMEKLLLLPYRGERSLTWTVAACAPSPAAPKIGNANPVSCRYANPSPLSWKPLLQPPWLESPLQGEAVNDRPQLQAYGTFGALHYLFCIVAYTAGSPPAGCGPGSVFVNTGTRPSTTGWEWSSAANSTPSGLSPQVFAGHDARWFVAACLDDRNCSWSNPAWVRVLPMPTLNEPLHHTYATSSQHEFFWTVPAQTQAWLTHYRLCVATQGSLLVDRRSTLVNVPGMLRDLCSDDIPPGDQPAYRKPVPPNLAPSCPQGGCRMPEPVATIYTTQARWIIDLREHPEWERFANQTLVWTAAACRDSNRNCMWRTDQYGTITFPPASLGPRWRPTGSGDAVTLKWEPMAGNAYYIPCVREPTATCENNNLLVSRRLVSAGASPSDHPAQCTLRGPYPTGTKVAQVAGCNDAWGCRWSDPQTFPNLGTNVAPHRQEAKFDCR